MQGIRGFLFLLALLCGLADPARHAQAAGDGQETPPQQVPHPGDTLQLGIVPFHATLTLLRLHRPLRDYLTCALGVDVMVYSAYDHEQFLNNAVNGYFDIVVAPAHFLPLLSDAGFVPLVRYRNPFELLLVVHKDSDISGVEDLPGHKIGLPDRLSFYYTVGMHWLSTLNLQAGTDYILDEYSSHMAELLAVDARQLDVAITGRTPWMMLTPDARKHLRGLDVDYPALPSMTTMARSSLGEAKLEKIRAALLSFQQSAEGKQFFVTTGYGGYVIATDADIDAGRIYEPRVRRLWHVSPPRQEAAPVAKETPQAEKVAPLASNAVKPCAPANKP